MGTGPSLFQGAPNDSWQYADDPAELRKLTDSNRRALGLQGKPCPVKKPMKAEDYFRQNVLSAFPSGSAVVSVEPFPELKLMARQQLGLAPDDAGNGGSARTDAIRARVEFQKDGKTLEDWVTLVVVTRIFRQGRGAFYDCHAIDVMALRAPKDQLDANDKLFKVMISSVRPEPKSQAYSNGVIAKLYQAEAQKEAAMDSMVAAFRQCLLCSHSVNQDYPANCPPSLTCKLRLFCSKVPVKLKAQDCIHCEHQLPFSCAVIPGPSTESVFVSHLWPDGD